MDSLLNNLKNSMYLTINKDYNYYIKCINKYNIKTYLSYIDDKIIKVKGDTENISKKIMNPFIPKQDYFINCPELYNWYNTKYRKVFEVLREKITIDIYFFRFINNPELLGVHVNVLNCMFCIFEEYFIPKLMDDYMYSILLVDITNKTNLPGDVTLNIMEFIGSQI